VHRPEAPPGPAANWLQQRFVDLGASDQAGGLAAMMEMSTN